jgi:hypothetical protein
MTKTSQEISDAIIQSVELAVDEVMNSPIACIDVPLTKLMLESIARMAAITAALRAVQEITKGDDNG